jgi:hypothetical protein
MSKWRLSSGTKEIALAPIGWPQRDKLWPNRQKHANRASDFSRRHRRPSRKRRRSTQKAHLTAAYETS